MMMTTLEATFVQHLYDEARHDLVALRDQLAALEQSLPSSTPVHVREKIEAAMLTARHAVTYHGRPGPRNDVPGAQDVPGGNDAR